MLLLCGPCPVCPAAEFRQVIPKLVSYRELQDVNHSLELSIFSRLTKGKI